MLVRKNPSPVIKFFLPTSEPATVAVTASGNVAVGVNPCRARNERSVFGEELGHTFRNRLLERVARPRMMIDERQHLVADEHIVGGFSRDPLGH